MLTRRRGSSPHIKWQDEEETGFVHDKISTENKKIAPQCPPPPASHPYAPKRRETSMLTRRRGSIPDIKWRGWGGGKIYPWQNFHRKNWKSRSAVPHQKIPEKQIFNSRKSFDHPRHSKSGVSHTPLPPRPSPRKLGNGRPRVPRYGKRNLTAKIFHFKYGENF